MNKILLVISELPYPKHKSGTATTLYNLCKEWNKLHDIDIIYYDEKANEAEDYYEKCGIKIKHENLITDKNRYFQKSLNKMTLKPRNCLRYNFSKLKAISVKEYDMVILAGFTSIYFTEYLKDVGKTKIIFFELDCLSLLYKRYYKDSDTILKKVYYYSQHLMVRRIEKLFYQYVDKVLFVSEVDKKYCIKYFNQVNENKFNNIVNGVEFYQKNEKVKVIDDQVVNVGFSGILDYTPNLKAVNFIVEHIIEKAIKTNKNLVFHIIGKNPPYNLKHYIGKYKSNFVITGFVDNINEYISNMDIYISPLFVGTGMKNKILQAMNLGVPIICTSVSAEGITELVNQENCIMCDSNDGEDWVKQIDYLINDIEKRKKFSDTTTRIILQNYSWNKVANEFLLISLNS